MSYYIKRDPTTVLPFKTNLQSADQVDAVRFLLDHHSKVEQWNVDLHDADNVLRIMPRPPLQAADVITLVRSAGFYCEELPD